GLPSERSLPAPPRSQATGLRVGRTVGHTCPYATHRPATAEKAVTRSVPRRHHDIADDLRHQITTGSIQPGERLPSEAGLAARYRVSTVTLRRALALLQGEGL